MKKFLILAVLMLACGGYSAEEVLHDGEALLTAGGSGGGGYTRTYECECKCTPCPLKGVAACWTGHFIFSWGPSYPGTPAKTCIGRCATMTGAPLVGGCQVTYIR